MRKPQEQPQHAQLIIHRIAIEIAGPGAPEARQVNRINVIEFVKTARTPSPDPELLELIRVVAQ
jgi:hypothetical protein